MTLKRFQQLVKRLYGCILFDFSGGQQQRKSSSKDSEKERSSSSSKATPKAYQIAFDTRSATGSKDCTSLEMFVHASDCCRML